MRNNRFLLWSVHDWDCVWSEQKDLISVCVCVCARVWEIPWLESWAAWERSVVMLNADGPAVRILWSIDCREACVTAAVRTTHRKQKNKREWEHAGTNDIFLNKLYSYSMGKNVPSNHSFTFQWYPVQLLVGFPLHNTTQGQSEVFGGCEVSGDGRVVIHNLGFPSALDQQQAHLDEKPLAVSHDTATEHQ